MIGQNFIGSVIGLGLNSDLRRPKKKNILSKRQKEHIRNKLVFNYENVLTLTPTSPL